MKLGLWEQLNNPDFVAPFTGAWIEMAKKAQELAGSGSLPSRERGLKLIFDLAKIIKQNVAPFTGAWIEII